MPDSVILTENQKQQLSSLAQSQIPNESCALLFGSIDGKKIIVKEIFVTKNLEESPVNFTISNQDLLDAYKRAEEAQLEVVGIFHSHPASEAYPSDTDKKFMFANPVVWVIFSGVSKEFKGFILESEIKEIQIAIS